MGYKIQVRDKGLKDLIQRVHRGGKAVVSVGILAKDGAEPHEVPEGSTAQPTTVIEVAEAMEFGTSNAPARPFVRNYADLHGAEVIPIVRDLLRAVIKSKLDPRQAYNQLGLHLQGGLQQFVADEGEGTYSGNAASTIAKKGSSVPLIDTGQLRQAISYKVSMRGIPMPAKPSKAGALVKRALKRGGKQLKKSLERLRKQGVKAAKKASAKAGKSVNRNVKAIRKSNQRLLKSIGKEIRQASKPSRSRKK